MARTPNSRDTMPRRSRTPVHPRLPQLSRRSRWARRKEVWLEPFRRISMRPGRPRRGSRASLRKQRIAQWNTYEADLQKSYQQEKDRYQKAMQKLDVDLQEAVATQDRLGAFLKQAHAASLLPEGTTDARMQATDPDWERLTRPVTQDSTHTEVEALTRLLGPDVRLWGQRLAALEGTGPPPGLEKAVHPTVPPEPSFGGKLDVPRDVHTDLGLDPFLAGKSGAPPAATEGSLDQNETSGIASPGTRPRATGSRTSVKAHTPPQFGRRDRPTLESKLEARRAALLAASRGPPDTEDREQQLETPRPGSPRTIWRPSPPCPDRKAGARKLGSTWRSHRQVWEPGRPSPLLTSERAGFSELLRNQCLCGGCVDLNSPRPFQFHLSRIVVSEILFPEVSLVRAPPTLVCHCRPYFRWVLGLPWPALTFSSAGCCLLHIDGGCGPAPPYNTFLAPIAATHSTERVPNNCVGGSGTVTAPVPCFPCAPEAYPSGSGVPNSDIGGSGVATYLMDGISPRRHLPALLLLLSAGAPISLFDLVGIGVPVTMFSSRELRQHWYCAVLGSPSPCPLFQTERPGSAPWPGPAAPPRAECQRDVSVALGHPPACG